MLDNEMLLVFEYFYNRYVINNDVFSILSPLDSEVNNILIKNDFFQISTFYEIIKDDYNWNWDGKVSCGKSFIDKIKYDYNLGNKSDDYIIKYMIKYLKLKNRNKYLSNLNI